MAAKYQALGDKPEITPPPNENLLSVSDSPKAARLMRQLPKPTPLLQVPYGLQYQGSSPRKHAKGNKKSSEKFTRLTRTSLRDITFLSTISAPDSAVTRNDNDETNPLTRIASTAGSPERDRKRARTMEIGDFFDESSQPTGYSPGLPNFASILASPMLHWQTDISASTGVDTLGITTPSLTMPELLSRDDLQMLQNEIAFLRNASNKHEHELTRYRSHVDDLVGFNKNVHEYLEVLHARMRILEADNARYRENSEDTGHHEHQRSLSESPLGASASYRPDADSPSIYPSPKESFAYMAPDDEHVFDVAAGDTPSGVGSFQKRDAAEVDIMDLTVNGLPTPTFTKGPPIVTGSNLPVLPPLSKQPFQSRLNALTGVKKANTMLVKRSVHNLNKILPPPSTQLPMMGITDTELIVYFFNSLARPICALRLYAHGSGPASITAILNEHRTINPPYLRNTCSVKCVTAIRRGKDLYGPDWEPNYRVSFKDADDEQATEIIRITNEDLEDTKDIDILDLLKGLRKHPNEESCGWFTHCVKYCEANGLHWPLSEVHLLAGELKAGRYPKAPFVQADDAMELDTVDTSIITAINTGLSDIGISSRESSVLSTGPSLTEDEFNVAAQGPSVPKTGDTIGVDEKQEIKDEDDF